MVRGDDGLWRMFYTGGSRAEDCLVQRIGVATLRDLLTWQRGTEGEGEGRRTRRLARCCARFSPGRGARRRS